MSTVKLYHYPISGPSRGALLAARAIDVPIKIEIVDLMKREQFSDTFLLINPHHCVPTLDDNGFVLWESRAIACYLADKYGKDDQLYPKDLKKRAIVNQRLYFDSSSLLVKIRAVCHPILFLGESEIKQSAKDDLNATLQLLNIYLSKSIWVAGDDFTIADTSIFASISNILSFDWDVSPFPDIQRWLKLCSSIPGYEENLDGAQMYGKLMKKNLKKMP